MWKLITVFCLLVFGMVCGCNNQVSQRDAGKFISVRVIPGGYNHATISCVKTDKGEFLVPHNLVFGISGDPCVLLETSGNCYLYVGDRGYLLNTR